MVPRPQGRPLPLVLPLSYLALALVPAWGRATDDAWIRYENAHFVAYSNAPEKKARPLLGDLETFRGAFLQVANITVPADGPKTMVLIPASKKEFRKLAASELQDGFATGDGRRTLIVMSAEGDKKLARTVIRHEYGHVLLRYKRFDYPAWYEEGFAELVSSTELVENGRAFTLGAPTKRAEQSGPPLFAWDMLVSDEFRFHSFADVRHGSSAYAQAWLLTHYATLGNNLNNAVRLQAYFDRLKDGEASTPAFEAAFGVNIDELWDTTLKPYARSMPFFTLPFRPGVLDPVFVATAPTAGEVEGLIRYLDLQAAITATPQPPPDVLAALTGRWAPLRLGLACEDYVEVLLTTATGTITVTPSKTDGAGIVEPAEYRYELAADRGLRLAGPGGSGDGKDELHIRHQNPDLLCINTGREQAGACSAVMYRCGG